jgi:hypothetical protein
MDTTPDLVNCDWCKCSISKKHIEKHKTAKCPKAPAEIIASRPKHLVKSTSKGLKKPSLTQNTPGNFMDLIKRSIEKGLLEKEKQLPSGESYLRRKIQVYKERLAAGGDFTIGPLEYPEPLDSSPSPRKQSRQESLHDWQINPQVVVTRMGDGLFSVQNVLSSGGVCNNLLQAKCKYCKQAIKVNANGPSDMPQFAKDEACRLALLEHLRTEDARPFHSPAH